MSEPNPEWLILAVTLIALSLAPVASRLVRQMGDRVSGEIDGGRSGDELDLHLDATYEGSLRDDEIAQMVAARDFVRSRRLGAAAGTTDAPAEGDAGPAVPAGQDDLRERRARRGEEPLDVEVETERRLAQLLGHAD